MQEKVQLYLEKESGGDQERRNGSIKAGGKMRNSKEERPRLHAWYDSHQLDRQADLETLLRRVTSTLYTGVLLYPENVQKYHMLLPGYMDRVIHLDNEEALTAFLALNLLEDGDSDNEHLWIVASDQPQVLASAAARGVATCLRVRVHDAVTLHNAIDQGRQHEFLVVSLCDPTNIPLELVIASLQTSRTIVIKEITNPNNCDDAIVSLGVMEVGTEGILFSPIEHDSMDRFLARLQEIQEQKIRIEAGTVLRTTPVGMGYRSCIDLVTLFSPSEGILIGSTSQGGILCCPEVFYLPYMELRPFRVNAGGVHSYLYNINNRTNYLTELKAGSQAMIVGVDGKVRQAPVGRSKTEVRPLRLIEVEFARGEQVNIFMQDDWHVRVFSDKGLPRNITELKPGDKVLGHVTVPGRHVGIKVEETIVES